MHHYYIQISHPLNRNNPFYVSKMCQAGHYISEFDKKNAIAFTVGEIDLNVLTKQYGALSTITLIPVGLA